MNSILTSIKMLLGITEECEDFDLQIIMHINSVFMILTQLGVGPEKGFTISDKVAIWSDFIEDTTKVEALKTYIYLRVKLMFDPPLNSSVTESINRIISELEWRLNIAAESKEEEVIQNE